VEMKGRRLWWRGLLCELVVVVVVEGNEGGDSGSAKRRRRKMKKRRRCWSVTLPLQNTVTCVVCIIRLPVVLVMLCRR